VVSGEKKMILDEEVLAVVIAILLIASIIGVVFIWRSGGEGFTAIGLLNENCRIGYYPTNVVQGQNLTLCIFVYNHMNKPIIYKVIYKLVYNSSELPTNTTPSPNPEIASWVGALNNDANATFLVSVSVPRNESIVGGNISLVFELWLLDPVNKSWIYTGEWVNRWVRVVE